MKARYLRVFAAFAAIILALEYIFDVLSSYDSVAEFFERAVIAGILAAGLTFFWFQFRPSVARKPPD